MSSKCPNFKKKSPKVWQVVKDLPKLEAVDDDEDNENMRKISFSTMDFEIRKLLQHESSLV